MKAIKIQIKRFGPDSVDDLYAFLKGRPQMLEGLTRSYIWENTQPGYFIGTYYTLSRVNQHVFSNIFYQFGSKDGNVIEEWYTSGEDYVETIRGIAAMFGPKVYFNLFQVNTGNELGWPFHSRRLEMTMATSKVRNVVDDSNDLKDGYMDQVAKLLAQEWWTPEQARQFVNITTSNPNGVSKVILSGTKVAAFGHAAYDENQAWINAIYVDSQFRGKGFGRKITEGIAFELRRRGVETVNLGVGEDNSKAIKTYREIGFGFTNFVRYRFKVA
ncbi:MAG: GNAT family N-acetyltransferase [Phycisphaerae bacterium]